MGNVIHRVHVLNYRGESLGNLIVPPAKKDDQFIGGNGVVSITVANVDGDPEYELVLQTTLGGIVVMDLPNSKNAKILWAMEHGNPMRSGEEISYIPQAQPGKKQLE